jgi:penicillin-binding protein 1A
MNIDKSNLKLYSIKILRNSLYLIFFIVSIITISGLWIKSEILPQLPSIASLRKIQMQVPLRIYSRDGAILAEYGEKLRTPLTSNEIPKLLIKAILAAEDDRFYKHFGIDLKSLVRAAVHLIKTGKKGQGASTITMQLTRNMYLTPKKTFKRKFKEMILAIQIEKKFTKDEILELYLNKIFMGNRAYGVAAAAQVYYNKKINELSLAQYAMLAGIPQLPSVNNPFRRVANSLKRRNYILSRMYKLNYITKNNYENAINEPVTAKKNKLVIDMEAPYLAEMARSYMVREYNGREAYTKGYKVTISVDSILQKAAQKSLRQTLINYDSRHGYRGPTGHVALIKNEWYEKSLDEKNNLVNKFLKKYYQIGNLIPVIVTNTDVKSISVYNSDLGDVKISWKNLSWTRGYKHNKKNKKRARQANQIFLIGDIIFIRQIKTKKDKPINWRLAQVPQAEGALVSLNVNNGQILALSGGFDFRHSKFNRVMQAKRQPGSNFKPFIYSAAIHRGFSPASIINDAPITIRAGKKIWKPENYGHKFYGPTTLRKALTLSRNLISIRLMRTMGVKYTIDYVKRFGFVDKQLPKNLTLSLGTASVTPLELVSAFAVLANGGYKVEPYFVEKITDYNNNIIFKATPQNVCRECKASDNESYATKVIDKRNAWLVTSMLKDVITRGTARRARVLKRKDLAGKTGTTNDQKDAWFSGYNAEIATTAWVGFDQPRSLGKKETGGKAALPMWIDFMRTALKDMPLKNISKPSGMVTLRVDKNTGLIVGKNHPNAIYDTFIRGNEPKKYIEKRVDQINVKDKSTGKNRSINILEIF